MVENEERLKKEKTRSQSLGWAYVGLISCYPYPRCSGALKAAEDHLTGLSSRANAMGRPIQETFGIGPDLI